MTAPGEQVRALRHGEEDEFLGVLCAAFHLDTAAARPLFLADPFFDLSHKRVLHTPEDGIVSVLTVMPSSMTLGKSIVPLGGIAGVATRPDRQGQGFGSRLLTGTLAAFGHELPYAAAALMAADARFYRKLGWEEAFFLSRWTGVPEGEDALTRQPVCPVPHENRALLHALHARVTAGQPGACQRDSRRWHIIDVLAPARQAWAVGEDSEAPAGFILLDRLDEAEPAYRIIEIVAETNAARAALQAFLQQPPFPCTRWEWHAAPSEFAALRLPPGQTTPVPGAMLRLCHLPRSLALRHAADFAPHLRGGRTLTLHVDDTALPANTQPVRLSERGVAVGEIGSDALACDVRTMAQVYTGLLPVTEAARQGRLSASSVWALELAAELFPPAEPCLHPADQF